MRRKNLYFKDIDPDIYKWFVELQIDLNMRYRMDTFYFLVKLAYKLHKEGQLIDIARRLGILPKNYKA